MRKYKLKNGGSFTVEPEEGGPVVAITLYDYDDDNYTYGRLTIQETQELIDQLTMAIKWLQSGDKA